AAITVPATHACDCAVQLEQPDLNLVGGVSYTVSFWAKATQSRSIRPAVVNALPPWIGYFSWPVDIESSWKPFRLTFTASRSDADAELLFNLANATGTVWIGDVRLVRA